jgi:hypothetical protein
MDPTVSLAWTQESAYPLSMLRNETRAASGLAVAGFAFLSAGPRSESGRGLAIAPAGHRRKLRSVPVSRSAPFKRIGDAWVRMLAYNGSVPGQESAGSVAGTARR